MEAGGIVFLDYETPDPGRSHRDLAARLRRFGEIAFCPVGLETFQGHGSPIA